MKKDLTRILEEALKRLGVKTVSSIEIEVPRQESMDKKIRDTSGTHP